MPVISVTIAPSSKETKKKLIEGLTEKAVKITSIPKEHFVVTIHELPLDALGCAGQTVEEMKKNMSVV